jgi:hypothetical protein
MAIHEADVEYGPTPENADHEHTDIDPAIAWKFAIWLSVAMAISMGIVYGTFWFLEGRAQVMNRAAQVFPLAAGQDRQPPVPHLQTQPFKDIYTLRQSESEKLTGYGWVDKGAGVTRIPIEDAMRLVVDKGIVVGRPRAAQVNQVVSDSSAGRMAVPR